MKRHPLPCRIESLENRTLFSLPAIGPSLAPVGVGVEVHATAGVAFDDEVGYLLPRAIPATMLLAGQIEWGDGTTSVATFVTAVPPVSPSAVPAARTEVFGSHTYKAAGDYELVINVQEIGKPITTAPVTATAPTTLIELGKFDSTAAVAPAPFQFSAGLDQTYNGSVGTFVSTLNLTNLTTVASIDWGDGTTSVGKVVAEGNDVYEVTGVHEYTTAGTFTVHVAVTAHAGMTAAGAASGVVIDVASFDSTARVVGPTAAELLA
jgi:hypothetical protein